MPMKNAADMILGLKNIGNRLHIIETTGAPPAAARRGEPTGF
ncbi:unnamed protein product, partial [Amoebophrya sp. A25]|eukprot:GSA25T00026976001.1